MADINKLIQFAKLAHQFYRIERRIPLPGENRLENDAEHSFQLALTAWYIIDAEHLPLSAEKAMKYGLAHDLVEIHAGDTYFFDKDPSVHASKKQREADAAQKLAAEYADFPGLHRIIDDYENLADEEAKFVYALDKLLPAISSYLDDGREWKEQQLTMETWLRMKRGKVDISPAIEKYFNLLLELLAKDESNLFIAKQ